MEAIEDIIDFYKDNEEHMPLLIATACFCVICLLTLVKCCCCKKNKKGGHIIEEVRPIVKDEKTQKIEVLEDDKPENHPGMKRICKYCQIEIASDETWNQHKHTEFHRSRASSMDMDYCISWVPSNDQKPVKPAVVKPKRVVIEQEIKQYLQETKGEWVDVSKNQQSSGKCQCFNNYRYMLGSHNLLEHFSVTIGAFKKVKIGTYMKTVNDMITKGQQGKLSGKTYRVIKNNSEGFPILLNTGSYVNERGVVLSTKDVEPYPQSISALVRSLQDQKVIKGYPYSITFQKFTTGQHSLIEKEKDKNHIVILIPLGDNCELTLGSPLQQNDDGSFDGYVTINLQNGSIISMKDDLPSSVSRVVAAVARDFVLLTMRIKI
ncbi:hypothetical protein WA158_006083 [Blastocystis sp. Blastoise]